MREASGFGKVTKFLKACKHGLKLSNKTFSNSSLSWKQHRRRRRAAALHLHNNKHQSKAAVDKTEQTTQKQMQAEPRGCYAVMSSYKWVVNLK